MQGDENCLTKELLEANYVSICDEIISLSVKISILISERLIKCNPNITTFYGKISGLQAKRLQGPHIQQRHDTIMNLKNLNTAILIL